MSSVKKGKRGERLARMRLEQLGFAMIEKVENAWNIARRGSMIVKAWPSARVAGDFRAVLPPYGQSVLVEVKATGNRNLRWSDFSEHQPGMLDAHAAAGGLSLVAWVYGECVFVMRWPIDQDLFRKGRALTPEEAESCVYLNEQSEVPLDFAVDAVPDETWADL